MTDKKLTGLDLLRAPFEPHQISKLCRSTKKDNTKGKCAVCGGWHGLPAIALDYVGHAALTDRLLDADPHWTWKPLALGADGYPLIDTDGGMWIELTICGITRLGYGDAQGKTGGDAMKERIGDALRNAAMRFGAALDLWHKGDLHKDDLGDNATAPTEQPQPPKPKPDFAFRQAMDKEKARLGEETYRALIQPYPDCIAAEGLDRAGKEAIIKRLRAAVPMPQADDIPFGLLDDKTFGEV